MFVINYLDWFNIGFNYTSLIAHKIFNLGGDDVISLTLCYGIALLAVESLLHSQVTVLSPWVWIILEKT